MFAPLHVLLDSHRFPHPIQWKITEIYENQLKTVKTNVGPWKRMDHHGKRTDFHGNTWKPIGNYEIPGTSMNIHGGQLTIMKNL